ncbi:MAG TPA: hypothetical protein DD381_11345 [Lentisphaeria bacterium]|nr:MAG: hypothetical protein A2X47_12770 [Lentisphaerae bacterium GWF2_38_69]HBM16924.1 hypothetical protein [Lentisphaeria bacterium]
MRDVAAYKEENGILTCIFSGKLDTVVSETISDDVFDHIQQAKEAVVFDFKNVDYVSSAFLRVAIRAARAVPGMKIKVINSLPDIRDVFRIAGLFKIFSFE